MYTLKEGYDDEGIDEIEEMVDRDRRIDEIINMEIRE